MLFALVIVACKGLKKGRFPPSARSKEHILILTLLVECRNVFGLVSNDDVRRGNKTIKTRIIGEDGTNADATL